MADYLKTNYQDKLRNKWSAVMSEIESKRSIARKAEDSLKEFNNLASQIQKWLDDIKPELKSANNYNNQSQSLREEFKSKEREIIKLNDIGKELKNLRVGYQEKLVNDINSDWTNVVEQYTTITSSSKDKEKHLKNVCYNFQISFLLNFKQM